MIKFTCLKTKYWLSIKKGLKLAIKRKEKKTPIFWKFHAAKEKEIIGYKIKKYI